MSLISPDVVPTLPMEEGVPEAADKVTRHTPALRGSTPEAERRQVTVLFCDLVDSTQLSQQLDAEDYRAVVRAYQEAAVAALRPWDGHVAQYLGDGLMVYFGWPRTHEDAATRAVHASLAMLEAMGPLNTRSRGTTRRAGAGAPRAAYWHGRHRRDGRRRPARTAGHG